MFKTLTSLALAATALSGTAQAASSVTIDLFSTDQATFADKLVDGKSRVSQVGSAADTTILGGYRELIIDLKSNGGIGSRKVEIGVEFGVLDLNTQTLTGATSILRWDGITQSADLAAVQAINPIGLQTAPGVGLNLGNAASDSIQLNFDAADASYKFVIEAYTDANHWSKLEVQGEYFPAGGVSSFAMSKFLACGVTTATYKTTCANGNNVANAVNFSNLGALQAIIDPQGTALSLDLTLNQAVTAVPEPTTMALMLAGMGLMMWRRRAA